MVIIILFILVTSPLFLFLSIHTLQPTGTEGFGEALRSGPAARHDLCPGYGQRGWHCIGMLIFLSIVLL